MAGVPHVVRFAVGRLQTSDVGLHWLTRIGTFMSVSAMRAGLEGPGDECQRCGRIYGTNCAKIDMICVCGSKNFRTGRLRYQRN